MEINRVVMPQGMQKQSINTEKVARIDFGDVLSTAIESVSDAERVSLTYDELLASGKLENVHDAMIAAQKAEITLNFALQIRKSVLEAYQELMRLQI